MYRRVAASSQELGEGEAASCLPLPAEAGGFAVERPDAIRVELAAAAIPLGGLSELALAPGGIAPGPGRVVGLGHGPILAAERPDFEVCGEVCGPRRFGRFRSPGQEANRADTAAKSRNPAWRGGLRDSGEWAGQDSNLRPWD
jgi:hypothetical protein